MSKYTTRALARKHSVVLNEVRRFDTTGKIKRKEEARNWNGKSVAAKIGSTLKRSVQGAISLFREKKGIDCSGDGVHWDCGGCGETLWQGACKIAGAGNSGHIYPASIGCGYRNEVSFDRHVMTVPGEDNDSLCHQVQVKACVDLIRSDPCDASVKPDRVLFKPCKVDDPPAGCCADTSPGTGAGGPAWVSSKNYTRDSWLADRAALCPPRGPSNGTQAITPFTPISTTDSGNGFAVSDRTLGIIEGVVGSVSFIVTVPMLVYIFKKCRDLYLDRTGQVPHHNPNRAAERQSRRSAWEIEQTRTHQTTAL